MSESIAVRIQMGVENPTQFPVKLQQDSTVAKIRQIIRAQQSIDSLDGIVLIWNGQRLKNPDSAMSDLGICNDSLIICIVSKETGKDIEQLIGDDEDAKYKDTSDNAKAVCEFVSRPLGFSVWPNEKGENAIVTAVAEEGVVKRGVKVGFCVYKVNDKNVFNDKHDDILELLRNLRCPLQIMFIDLALQYSIRYTGKPLGFTVIEDRKGNNARVRKITKERKDWETPQIGSYITAVGGKEVFGEPHQDIINLINNASFPFEVQFRHLPKLFVENTQKDVMPTNIIKDGDLERKSKSKRSLFKWFAGKSEAKKDIV